MSNYTYTTQCHTKARGAVHIHNVTTPYYTSTTRYRAKHLRFATGIYFAKQIQTNAVLDNAMHLL